LTYQDKVIVLLQVFEMLDFSDEILKSIRQIFLKMNKTLEV